MNDPTFVQEYNAVLDVLYKYVEGGVKADSSIMKPSFSEQATIFCADNEGKLAGGPIQGLFDIIDTVVKPAPNSKPAVVRIDIVGTAASARVDLHDRFGFRFTDFFNLLKIEGKWTIINKVFHVQSSGANLTKS